MMTSKLLNCVAQKRRLKVINSPLGRKMDFSCFVIKNLSTSGTFYAAYSIFDYEVPHPYPAVFSFMLLPEKQCKSSPGAFTCTLTGTTAMA